MQDKTKLKAHAFADLFPRMTKEEDGGLKASIRAEGLNVNEEIKIRQCIFDEIHKINVQLATEKLPMIRLEETTIRKWGK